MLQIIKFKINNIIERKSFFLLNIIFFAMLNILVYSNTKILTQGSESFNYNIKYEIYSNNFVLTSLFFGIVYACYLGSNLIENDINTGKIYIILTSYPSRKKYYLLCISALVLIVVCFIFLINLNYVLLGSVIKIKPILKDMILFNKDMILNTVTLIALSAAASLIIKNRGSIIVSIVSAIFFCLYTTEQIPIVNLKLEIPELIKEFMGLIFPIRMIFLSFVDESIKSIALINPFGIHMSLVQLIYIFLIVFVSIKIFEKKHL